MPAPAPAANAASAPISTPSNLFVTISKSAF